MNPYEPPQSSGSNVPSDAKEKLRASFPFAMVFRWLLSAALLVLGALRMVDISGKWAFLSDRAILDPMSDPVLLTAVSLSIFIAGVLLAFRSRWVFLPIAAHLGCAIKMMFAGAYFSSGDVFSLVFDTLALLSADFFVLAFCLWLWMKKRLR